MCFAGIIRYKQSPEKFYGLFKSHIHHLEKLSIYHVVLQISALGISLPLCFLASLFSTFPEWLQSTVLAWQICWKFSKANSLLAAWEHHTDIPAKYLTPPHTIIPYSLYMNVWLQHEYVNKMKWQLDFFFFWRKVSPGS